MSLFSSVLDRIPNYVPKDELRFEDTIKFEYVTDSSPKTVYTLSKAPVERLTEVTSTVDGQPYKYDIGTEVELRDADSDGDLDSIAFIDSDVYPDEGAAIDSLYVAESFFKRYTEPFSADLDALGDDLNAIQKSKYIELASGRQLDLIGRGFGDLGLRRNRNDDEYRDYLLTLIRAFDARGTINDITFVTAGLFRVDEEKVTVDEDYHESGFEVRVYDPDVRLDLNSVNELIRLSSPTGVELLSSVSLIQSHQLLVGGNVPAVNGGVHTIDLVSGSTMDSSDGLGTDTLSNGTTLR